jgi:hypothetical protein
LTEAAAQPRARASLPERAGAALLALCCLAPLVVAAGLTPDPAGAGTHTQLGIQACGWAVSFGVPCPTCGMTTAFAHVAHLDLLAGLKAQPLGFLLAVGSAAGFWVALHVAATGSLIGRTCGRMLSPRNLWVLAAVAAGSWAYKWLTWPAP